MVIAIGLLPVLLATGLPVSLSAPLANLVAVPWVSLAVLPLALLGTLLLPLGGVGEALLWLAGGLLDVLFRLLELVAQQQSAWLPAVLPLWAWLLVCLGTLLVLMPRGVPLRGLGGVMLLALWVPRETVPFGQVEVWQLDVGQGLAVLLRTRHHNLLYDAGPARARATWASGWCCRPCASWGGQPGPDAGQPRPCRPRRWCWRNHAWPAGRTGDRRRIAG